MAEHGFAALLEGAAVAVVRKLFEQAAHCLDPGHLGIEFGELFSGKLAPTLGCGGDFVKTEEQFADLGEREAELARALDEGEAVKYGVVVAALATGALGAGQQPNALVIADGRRLKPGLAGHMGNGEPWHGLILRSPGGDYHGKLGNPGKNMSCLKVNFKL